MVFIGGDGGGQVGEVPWRCGTGRLSPGQWGYEREGEGGKVGRVQEEGRGREGEGNGGKQVSERRREGGRDEGRERGRVQVLTIRSRNVTSQDWLWELQSLAGIEHEQRGERILWLVLRQ